MIVNGGPLIDNAGLIDVIDFVIADIFQTFFRSQTRRKFKGTPIIHPVSIKDHISRCPRRSDGRQKQHPRG